MTILKRYFGAVLSFVRHYSEDLVPSTRRAPISRNAFNCAASLSRALLNCRAGIMRSRWQSRPNGKCVA